MSKQIFYVTCIYPTQRVTCGKNYDVITETDDRITVINDLGSKSNLMRFRFGELQVREEKIKKGGKTQLLCTEAKKFKNISEGNMYDIVQKDGNFYEIINDKGVQARYSSQYFEVKEVEGEKNEVESGLPCVFPISGELTFAKKYEVEKINDQLVKVVNDKGEKKEYISKRFKMNEDA